MALLPTIVGHRGVTETAPENTLAAFAQAAREGALWVEFDVQIAGDGGAVVIHDGDLNRVGSRPESLQSLSAADLGEIDVGSHYDAFYADQTVPSLRDVMTACADLGLGANVELKDDGADARTTAQQSWQVLAPFLGHVPLLISAFNHDALREIRAITAALPLDDLPLGALYVELPKDWRDQVADFAPTSIHLWHGKLTDQNITDVTAAGFELMVYSVDNTGLARRLRHRGVRSLCTGMPSAIAAALNAKR